MSAYDDQLMGGADDGDQGESHEEVQGSEFEAEALQQGWAPKEQFRGNEDDWVDAETFVKRGREINPILRANNKRLEAQIASLRQELNKRDNDIAEIREFNKKMEDRAYERAINELKAQKRAAMAQGDMDAAAQAEEALDDLRTNRPKSEFPEAKSQQQVTINPYVEQWHRENSWYNESNPEAYAYANGLVMTMRSKYPNATPEQILPIVTQEVAKKFLGNAGSRKIVPAVGGGGATGGAGASSSGGKHSFSAVPAADRKAFTSFYESKYYGNKSLKDAQAEFAAQYFASDIKRG